MTARNGFTREPDLQPPLDYAVDDRDPCDLARDARQRESDEQKEEIERQARDIAVLQSCLIQKRARVERLERNIARFAEAVRIAQEAFTEARRHQEGD